MPTAPLGSARMGRVAAICLAVTVASMLSVVTAGPAPAPPLPQSCASISNLNDVDRVPRTGIIDAQVGDIVAVQVTQGASASGPVAVDLEVNSVAVTSGTTPVTLTYTFTTAGIYSIGLDGLSYVNQSWSCSPVSSVTAQTPPSHLQQVGLPDSGSCSDVRDDDLGWGTGLAGGWSRAWGEWMIEGRGGWVCSRTMVYSSSTGRWLLNGVP